MSFLKDLPNWKDVLERIKKELHHKVFFDAWFTIIDYDLESDIEFSNITITFPEEGYLPLILSSKEIVFQLDIPLTADGYTTFYDYLNSPWDSDERDYYYKVISSLSFEQAVGSFKCEVHINFDSEDEGSDANGKKKQSSVTNNKKAVSSSNIEKQEPLIDVRIIEPYGIQLDLNEERINTKELHFESDAEADMLDALENNANH